MNFKQFLNESEELLSKIKAILDEMDSEELDDFGTYLVDMFMDDLPEDDYNDEFDKEDVIEMIKSLGLDFYDEILEELSEIEDDWDEDGETNEAASRRMKTSNYNRKKRKFMSNSKSDMRKTKAARKKKARQNKQKNKRYYKANKTKIAAYQKSRSAAIKKGKHKVKQRRQS